MEVTPKFKTFYPVLAVMAAWLAELGVTRAKSQQSDRKDGRQGFRWALRRAKARCTLQHA